MNRLRMPERRHQHVSGVATKDRDCRSAAIVTCTDFLRADGSAQSINGRWGPSDHIPSVFSEISPSLPAVLHDGAWWAGQHHARRLARPDRGRRGPAGRRRMAHPADPAGALASHSCGLTSRRGTGRSNSIPGRQQSVFGSFMMIIEP